MQFDSPHAGIGQRIFLPTFQIYTKGGQRPLGADEYWVRLEKGEILNFPLYRYENETVCKWGQKRERRFATLVPTKYTII